MAAPTTTNCELEKAIHASYNCKERSFINFEDTLYTQIKTRLDSSYPKEIELLLKVTYTGKTTPKERKYIVKPKQSSESPSRLYHQIEVQTVGYTLSLHSTQPDEAKALAYQYNIVADREAKLRHHIHRSAKNSGEDDLFEMAPEQKKEHLQLNQSNIAKYNPADRKEVEEQLKQEREAEQEKDRKTTAELANKAQENLMRGIKVMCIGSTESEQPKVEETSAQLAVEPTPPKPNPAIKPKPALLPKPKQTQKQ
ncbi:hypothetical protein D5018_13565 [Parashewanella curva]|uniref:Uncharacterized protein n=1 Tax=Parashewanella curva TaxID=2338552 RepID=A0A3L8PV29_9GAMM|nr:hypothetical protein [Parashewanella curva]RLV59164.1 hypothetical protein D5018_13565 [Parashewanella curva]